MGSCPMGSSYIFLLNTYTREDVAVEFGLVAAA
jgi:hypothetical protein